MNNKLSDLFIDPNQTVIENHKPIKRRYSSFIRGPIPFHWLTDAGKLGGSALQVGLTLWLFVSRSKQASIRASLKQLGVGFEVSEQAARRAVVALEKAGLITVKRAFGRKSVFTLKLERYLVSQEDTSVRAEK